MAFIILQCCYFFILADKLGLKLIEKRENPGHKWQPCYKTLVQSFKFFEFRPAGVSKQMIRIEYIWTLDACHLACVQTSPISFLQCRK